MKIKANKNKLKIIKKKTKIRRNGSNYVTSIPAFIAELYDIDNTNIIVWKYNPNTNELNIELR